ncbi:hypothetical protein Tco_0323824 [Tanacetum coccineum]
MDRATPGPTEGYGEEAIVLLEIKGPIILRLRQNLLNWMNATSSKTDERIDKLADQLSTLVEIISKKVVTTAPVKAVEETYAKIPLNENCSAMLLKKLPEKLGDPGKFLIPCNFPGMDDFLNIFRVAIPPPTSELFSSEIIFGRILEAYLKDDSISPEIDHADCNPEEDICLIEKLLNNDPFQLPPMDLKQSEVTEAKSSIEEPPELELKDLPSHLEYAFLEENDKLPVIIAKGLKNDEKDALLKVLKSHK